ncbi:MAG: PfkB family carbohydrate kinase [Chloroflexota bacterium]
MRHLNSFEPVDYLVIGHITVDLVRKSQGSGQVLGGSVSYAALTARAMGLRVGIVTAHAGELSLSELDGIPIVAGEAEHSSTFENVYTPAGRIQYIRHTAPKIDFSLVPESWRRAKIIHLAPVAQEVDCQLPADFHPELLGLSPQGWMRTWDGDGRVFPCAWDYPANALAEAGAVVFSVEDVARNEEVIDQLAHDARILAATEGAAGVRLFWNGDSRRFRPPSVVEVDPTGAGDVFSAAFFARLVSTRDPWEAARFANRMAAISVTRAGMSGVPTVDEVRSCMVEVLD